MEGKQKRRRLVYSTFRDGPQKRFTPCTRLWDLAAGKTMTTLTYHKKWKCPKGNFIFYFGGHDAMPLPCFQDAFRDNFFLFSNGTEHDKDFLHAPSGLSIDFEVAIQFPAECPETERVLIGLDL